MDCSCGSWHDTSPFPFWVIQECEKGAHFRVSIYGLVLEVTHLHCFILMDSIYQTRDTNNMKEECRVTRNITFPHWECVAAHKNQVPRVNCVHILAKNLKFFMNSHCTQSMHSTQCPFYCSILKTNSQFELAWRLFEKQYKNVENPDFTTVHTTSRVLWLPWQRKETLTLKLHVILSAPFETQM